MSCSSRCRTPGSAFPPTRSATSSRSSGRRTSRSAGSLAGPGSGCPSPRGWSSCTAAGSGSRARRGRARRSSSEFRCAWRRSERHEDDPLRRGQRVQPQDRAAPAGPHHVPPDRGPRRGGRRGQRPGDAPGPRDHGHPAAEAVRARGHAPARRRAGDPGHPDHRDHLVRARRRRAEGEGGGRRRLPGQALQPARAARDDPRARPGELRARPPVTAPSGRPSPWRVLAAATALIAPVGAIYAFSVFLRPLEALLGLGRADLALVFAVAAAGFGVGMMLAPTLYGRLAMPWLVLGCASVSAVGIALAATAGGLLRLAVGYGVLFGLGGGAAYILVQQMANLAVTARHGLVNGYLVSLLPAGAMIGAPLFGWAIRLFGVRATLGGFAVTLALTGIAGAWLTAGAGVTLAAATAVVIDTRERRRPVFWRLSLVFFLAASAGLMVLSQAAGIIAAYGGATWLAVYGTTLITATVAGARLAGGWMVDWLAIP